MSQKNNKETIEELLEELNKQSAYLEFAYGAELEDNDDDRRFKVIKDLVSDINSTIKRLSLEAKDQVEKLKNDEKLKASFDKTMDKAVSVLNEAKDRLKDTYQSDEVQNALNSAKENVGKAYEKVREREDVQKAVETAKAVTFNAVSKTGEVIKNAAKQPLVAENAEKLKNGVAKLTVTVCEAFAKWLRK